MRFISTVLLATFPLSIAELTLDEIFTADALRKLGLSAQDEELSAPPGPLEITLRWDHAPSLVQVTEPGAEAHDNACFILNLAAPDTRSFTPLELGLAVRAKS